MRRMFAMFLAVVFAMTVTVGAAPAGKGAAKTSTVNGAFVGFQENKHVKKVVITVTTDDGKTQEQAIKLDDSTKITLDGNTVAASDLRPGEKLSITLTKKIATQITATSN